MLRISLLFIFSLFLISCGKNPKRTELTTGYKAEIIDMEADEDGDGILNSSELKKGLDRYEFNRPLLDLSEERVSIMQDFQTTTLVISQKKKEALKLIPNSAENLSYQYLALPQLSIKERWAIEKMANENQLIQVVIDGQLDWSLPEIFQFSYLNVGLGIFDWSSRKVIPLESHIILNKLNSGKLRWIFNLTSTDKQRIQSQNLSWDFVLNIQESQWNIGNNVLDWNHVKHNLVHIFHDLDEDAKVYPIQYPSQNLLPTQNDLQLYLEREAVTGLPILERGQVYFVHEKGLNLKERENETVQLKISTQDVRKTQILKSEKKKWERIDISLVSPEFSKIIKTDSVNVTWIGQKPCDSGRWSKILCEGQTLNMQCQAHYETVQENLKKVVLPSDKIQVELETRTISLETWMDMSGATLLDNGLLLRWEGELMKSRDFIPKSFQWQKENKTFSLGYIGLNCPSTPANSIQRSSFNQSRFTTDEVWNFEVKQFQY